MSQTSENVAWWREKAKQLRDYSDKTRDVRGAMASRGFSSMPGVVQESMIKFERDVKLSLAEVNMKIAENEASREMKRVESQYGIDLKEYQREWEIDKVALLNEMQQYITTLKKLQRLDEQAIERETIEIERQRTTILASETEIKLQLEGYDQDMVGLRNQTLPYERDLVAARIRTLNRKLELIPYLNQLIDAEEAALNAVSNDLIPAKRNLLAVMQTLIEEKEALVPVKIDLLQKEYDLAEKQIEVAEKEGEVAERSGDVAAREIDVAEKEEYAANSDREVIDSREGVLTAEAKTLDMISDNADSEKANAVKDRGWVGKEEAIASKEMGVANKRMTAAESEIELSGVERGTIEKSEEAANAESAFRAAYGEKIVDILNTEEIQKKIAAKDLTLAQNDKTYLEIRKLIEEARQNLRDMEIDYILAGLGYDKEIAEYRAGTRLNASIATANMLVGNKTSSGLGVGTVAGRFEETSDNIDKMRDALDVDAFDKDLTTRQAKLERERDSVSDEIYERAERPRSGAYAKDGAFTSWSATGIYAAEDAVIAAAEELAAKIAAENSEITTTLKHVLRAE